LGRAPAAELKVVIRLEENMANIRTAIPSDAESITGFDHVAQSDLSRVRFITWSINAGQCYVIEHDKMVVAYGVLEYSFYGCGFISMLYVHPEFRRRGFGFELMKYLERSCKTEKLFTSTNQSNTTMQSLLENLGYQRSGVIENLDEGDPEIIYFKQPVDQAG
jgi:ribosomal protein S18 acetylase RimI-like enzyme